MHKRQKKSGAIVFLTFLQLFEILEVNRQFCILYIRKKSFTVFLRHLWNLDFSLSSFKTKHIHRHQILMWKMWCHRAYFYFKSHFVWKCWFFGNFQVSCKTLSDIFVILFHTFLILFLSIFEAQQLGIISNYKGPLTM